jgi:hypothetical protein
MVTGGRLAGYGDVMRRVEANVKRAGWHATGVFGGGALFMYTTGLTGGDHPELVITGLPADAAHGVLAAAVDVIRGGTPLVPGRDYEGIAAGFPVRFREVDQDNCTHPLSVTTLYYGKRVPALQLLWPDPEGRFPGEPGCDPVMAAVQDIAEVPGD